MEASHMKIQWYTCIDYELTIDQDFLLMTVYYLRIGFTLHYIYCLWNGIRYE